MIRSFINSVLAYGKALRLTNQLKLWSYFWVPVIVSIVLGVGIGWTAWTFSDEITNWLVDLYPFDWGRGVVDTIAQVFGGLLIAALGFILFKALVIALASPFMSFLSEKIERHLYQGGEARFTVAGALSDLVRGLRIALRLVVRELTFTLLLILLGAIIPPIGILIPFAIFAVQAYYAGFGNMDFTLERHFRVKGSVAFVRRNRGLALGNGAVYLLLYLTVIGFLVALPLSTIAGATVTLKRLQKENRAAKP